MNKKEKFKPKNRYVQIARAENVGQLIRALSVFPEHTPVIATTEQVYWGELKWPLEVCFDDFGGYIPDGVVNIYGRADDEHIPHVKHWEKQERLYLGSKQKIPKCGNRKVKIRTQI